MRHSRICRVCGRWFASSRADAMTCTDTCRSRLRRGGDLAYLSGLSRREQRAHRKLHALSDAARAAHKEHVVAVREAREAKREVREQEAEEARERLLNEIVGARLRETEREQRLTGAVRSVAGCLKYMLRERHNDFSAEAITALLNRPDSYPLELVTEALAKLGAYDRILAEPVE
jgi:hypothetical protein